MNLNDFVLMETSRFKRHFTTITVYAVFILFDSHGTGAGTGICIWTFDDIALSGFIILHGHGRYVFIVSKHYKISH